VILWWIGNAVLVLVVVPVLVSRLRRVVRAAAEVDRHLDVLGAAGAALVRDLDAVAGLVRTRSLVGETKARLARYGQLSTRSSSASE
jgi:hypothetical protein